MKAGETKNKKKEKILSLCLCLCLHRAVPMLMFLLRMSLMKIRLHALSLTESDQKNLFLPGIRISGQEGDELLLNEIVQGAL